MVSIRVIREKRNNETIYKIAKHVSVPLCYMFASNDLANIIKTDSTVSIKLSLISNVFGKKPPVDIVDNVITTDS